MKFARQPGTLTLYKSLFSKYLKEKSVGMRVYLFFQPVGTTKFIFQVIIIIIRFLKQVAE